MSVGRSGLRWTVRERAFAAVACSAAAGLGCSREDLVVGSQFRDPSGVGGADDPGSVGFAAAANSTDNVIPEGCPPSVADRRVLDGCWPPRQIGRWRGFFTGRPRYATWAGAASGFPETDLVLRLTDEGQGTLLFGEGTLPMFSETASDPYLCNGVAAGAECPAAQHLVQGFFYTLENVMLRDKGTEGSARIRGEELPTAPEQLSFEIRLAEPWQKWCALQVPQPVTCPCAEPCSEPLLECYRLAVVEAPGGACTLEDEMAVHAVDCGWLSAWRDVPCDCSAEGCVALGSVLSFSLRLSDGGGAMRGDYEGGGIEFQRETSD
jgi:hypothetical protein